MTEQIKGLEVREVSGVSVVKFTDRKILDAMQIAEIEDGLLRALRGWASTSLIISFANVELLSSAALGMLLKVKTQIDSIKGRLLLSDINPRILEVFKITGLNKVFEIHDTGDKAIKSIA